jgi:hypothetical protein
MRAIFGLVGILVVVGIIVYWMGPGGGLSHTQTVLKEGQNAQEQVAQIGGKDTESHEPANESAVLDPQSFGGKLDSILVTKVVPGGAYEKYFGLKTNDAIVSVETNGYDQKVNQMGDGESAKIAVMDAYSKSGHDTVMRDGNEVKLPTASKPKGQAPKTDDSNPLQRQLDTIQQIPGSR